MQFEILKFESVTSTNDVAINLIKKKKKKLDAFMLVHKQKVEEHKEKDGFLRWEIYLDQFFFH